MTTPFIQVRHVGLVVKDLQRALGFYQELLGLEEQRRMIERGPVIENMLGLKDVEVETVKLGTKDGITQIELLSFRSHPVAGPEKDRTLMVGLTHLAFTVDNLPQLYSDLSARGVLFQCPPQTSADGRFRLTYCQDPEGTWIELVEVL